MNYDYDVFGNRYQYQSQNGGNPFSQVWVESGQISQTTNRFTSGVTYDDAGNITVDSKFRNLSFQYDANNRQKQSSDGTTTVVSVYDAGGQRVATQVSGALTNELVYDAGGKLLAEYGSAPPATGGTQYVFSDHQGSPRAITNGSGAIVSRHDYAPFGEELGAIGMRASTPGYGNGDNARQKYGGMESDDAGGLDHTLWRQYDSSSGRWTSPDPYGGSMSAASPQSFNRYSYVNNDPVNQSDPSGLFKQVDQGNPDNPRPDEEPLGDPFETGRGIIAAAEARHDRWVDIDRRGGDYGDDDYPSQSPDHEAPATHESEHAAPESETTSPATATVDIAESTIGSSGLGEPQKRILTFDQLWQNHPGVNSDKTVTLCSQFEGENCTIRLSVALQRSGMDMSSFKGWTCNPTTGGRAAIFTGQLANWLDKHLSKSERLSTSWHDLTVALAGRRGIIYIRGFLGNDPGRWNHIDLWDGRRFQMGTGALKWIYSDPKEVRFWEIK